MGYDPSKNPERLILLSGKMEFEMKESAKDASRKKILDASDGPVELVMPPRILHRVRALTDVWYIEPRQTHFNPEKSDCYSEEIFSGR